MNCRNFQQGRALASLLPGNLRPFVERRLHLHAAGCPACRELDRRQQAVPDLLQRAYREQAAAYTAPSPLPIALPRAAPVRSRLNLATSGVALAAVLLAAGAYTLRLPPGQKPGPTRTARMQPPVPHDAAQPADSGASPRSRSGSDRVHAAPAPGSTGRLAVAPAPFGDGRHATVALPARPVRSLSDEQYLDGRDPHLASIWMQGAADDPEVLQWMGRPLPPMRDDFVRAPLPLLASGDGAGAAAAIRQQEEEAKVVDARLFRKVTLSCKALPLDALCAQLSEQTGVKIQAARGVRDENVTIFVEDRPARDVMREVVRLFGYMFARSGEPNAYKYELQQDLRSQLAEDELRNRDIHQALLDLDEKMAAFRPYLQQDLDALIARVERNKDGKDAEAARLFRFVKGGGWGPAQVYFRLTAAERGLLLGGQQLRLTLDDPNPDRRLPAEWKTSLLKSSGLRLYPSGVVAENLGGNTPSTPIHLAEGMEPFVILQLDRSEAGEFSLEVSTSVQQGGSIWQIARGSNPATRPDNARLNAALKTDPLFQPRISLEPRPSCPELAVDAERKKRDPLDRDYILDPELKEPHVSSADVWEELHRRTHLPIVADAYTRIFPLSAFKLGPTPTFEVLCKASDTLGVRWRKDGDFVLGRSATFFWDKTKEVPVRTLRLWREDRDRNQGLPLEDLLAMATLSDEQLGSRAVGLGITHCWGLDEWGIIGGGPFIAGEVVPTHLRKMARALSTLTPAQLAQARKLEGLSMHALKHEQSQLLSDLFGWPATLDNPNRVHVSYIPRGRYVWQPFISRKQYDEEGKRWPRISADTREAALAAARKLDPNTPESSIHRSRGRLDIVWITPQGELIGPGGPFVVAPLE